jgi:hypothetical protein
MRHRLILAALALLSLTSPVEAAGNASAPQRSLGTFGNWGAYATTEHGQSICYMTLTARFPKNVKFHRGDARLTITHRPTENSADVVSYTAGYNFRPASAVDIHIGKKDFNLFTAQDPAWARDAVTDHKLAAAIRSAPSLTITGAPVKADIAALTDKFGLKGAAEAYRAIGKACGVAVAETPAPAAALKTKKRH